jgi:hypothetical protein
MRNRIQVELTKSFGGSWYKGAKKHLRREHAEELIARGEAIAVVVFLLDEAVSEAEPSEIKVVGPSEIKIKKTRKRVKKHGDV